MGPRRPSFFRHAHTAMAAAATPPPARALFAVESPNVTYGEELIEATYDYHTTVCERSARGISVRPVTKTYEIRTARRVPKTGLLLVGWGGNNGTTLTAGVLANKLGLRWEGREGELRPNYYGSLTQASTVRVGSCGGEEVYVPLKELLPLVAPDDLVLGGWDISSMNLGDALKRAKVLDPDLRRQLYGHMKGLAPLPSIFFPEFVAASQAERADNVLRGSKPELVSQVRAQIRGFKAAHGLDKAIVVWSGSTECFAEVREGLNDTWASLEAAIQADAAGVSPSTLMCVAALLEGCAYLNGSPQNTFVPGVVELALARGVFIGGDDLKTGQTKMKAALLDYLVSAGIKPEAIASYNHLGNNDGKNLASPACFRSKEASKSSAVEGLASTNRLLYGEGERPDHAVVIKYLPSVGDSKRAMDEYTSRIFLNGLSTVVLHNTCEDSLLAAPLLLDLLVLTEVAQRITLREKGSGQGFRTLHPVLSALAYLTKAPAAPPGVPVASALYKQRDSLVNLFRACVGLQPDSHMHLEHTAAPGLPACADGAGQGRWTEKTAGAMGA